MRPVKIGGAGMVLRGFRRLSLIVLVFLTACVVVREDLSAKSPTHAPVQAAVLGEISQGSVSLSSQDANVGSGVRDSDTPVLVPLRAWSFVDETTLLSEIGVNPSPKNDAVVTQALKRLRGVDASTLRDCRSGDFSFTRTSPPPFSLFACLPVILAGDSLQQHEKKDHRPRLHPTRNWRMLRDRSLTESLQLLRPSSLAEISEYINAVESQRTCQHQYGFMVASLRTEPFLPDPAAREVIEKIYGRISACFSPEMQNAELLHLRMGLLRLAWGMHEAAAEALQQALVIEGGGENFRTLFWLGLLRTDVERNRFWDLLVEQWPLEFHSILADHLRGRDPVRPILENEEPLMEVRAPKSWTRFSWIAFFSELMVARGNSSEIEEWHRFVLKNVRVLTKEQWLFLAHGAEDSGDSFAAISFLSRYLAQASRLEKGGRRSILSLSIMKSYFPLSFGETIRSFHETVDPRILMGLIRQESSFQPRARSVANALGLMQVLPQTARRFLQVEAKELYDPQVNLEVGTRFLHKLSTDFDGRVEDVLAAYNAGPGNARAWRKRYGDLTPMLFSDLIPFRETRFYVTKILRNAYWYGRLENFRSDVAMGGSVNPPVRSAMLNSLLQDFSLHRTSPPPGMVENVFEPLFSLVRADIPMDRQE